MGRLSRLDQKWDDCPEILCIWLDPGHIQINNIVFVPMFFEVGIPGYLIIPKQFPRVTGLIIVGTEHLCSIGLTEPTWPAYAGQILCRSDRIVDQSDQTGLIDIFTFNDSFKPRVSGIQIRPHLPALSHAGIVLSGYVSR